ncbi:MAG: arginine--tRNA ligase, partial [Acidobacteriota bacterium]
MLEQVRRSLAVAIAEALQEMGIEQAQVALEVPPRRELGDLAWPGALPLAKALRRPPRAIAEEVVARLAARLAGAPASDPLALLEPECRVEGPGFVNLRLRRGSALTHLLTAGIAPATSQAPGAGAAAAIAAPPPSPGLEPRKVIVEHTNINPNKAAHIGHLRNAVLGDILVRCLRWLGETVEVQDYIDDTGVQVADVVVGFLFLPAADLTNCLAPFWPEIVPAPEDGVRARALAAFAARQQAGLLVAGDLGRLDFDDLCWELYPRVTRWYQEAPAATACRGTVLHAVEQGFPAELTLPAAITALAEWCGGDSAVELPAPAAARFAAAVAESNVRCHLNTMGRLAIAYDVLPHESDILHRGFWRHAFEMLESAAAIRRESEGKNAGCWVMSLADSPEFAGMADADKILVRSNGTVTYTGKDIAYQLWKLGLLRAPGGERDDFGYQLFASFSAPGPAAPVEVGQGDRAVYRTAADPAVRPPGVAFGAGARVYNVIDVRQSYPQKVVKEAIRVLGFPAAAESSIHFAYEMVALTPAAVRRLEAAQGVDFGLTEEEMAKPFIEMSGRRGIGV